MGQAPHNTFEALLAEAHAADAAGVFQRSTVDAAALLSVPVQTTKAGRSRLAMFLDRAAVGLPVAACLAIMVGITTSSLQDSSVVSSMPLAMNTNGVGGVEAQLFGPDLQMEVMVQCFSGPGQSASDSCEHADLDLDGDVDLVDFGQYQQLSALSGMN